MIEIEIRRFQSIEHVTLSIKGFTALAGRSNIGKSAVIRAVQAALGDPPSADYIRHGATCARRVGAKKCKCTTSVRIQMPGFDLLWEKGDGVNCYKFNGADYNSVGQGTPDFLPGFLPVKIGDKKTMMQVADQFYPMFLLDRSGGAVADLLSDVANLDRINVASRMTEKDLKEASSTLKLRQRDVNTITAELAGYDGLDATIERVGGVQTGLAHVQDLSQRVQKLDGFIATVMTVGRQLKALQAVTAVVVPDVTPVREGASDLVKVEKWCVELDAREGVITHLSGVDEVTVPVLAPDVPSWIEQVKKIDRWTTGLQDREGVITHLSGVDSVTIPASPSVAAQSEMLAKLTDWILRLRAFKALSGGWKALEATVVPEPPDSAQALHRLRRLDLMKTRLDTLTREISGIQADLDNAEAQEVTVLDEAKAVGVEVCPTCAQLSHLGGH